MHTKGQQVKLCWRNLRHLSFYSEFLVVKWKYVPAKAAAFRAPQALPFEVQLARFLVPSPLALSSLRSATPTTVRFVLLFECRNSCGKIGS